MERRFCRKWQVLAKSSLVPIVWNSVLLWQGFSTDVWND